jgi:hypothetical protein
VKERDPGQNEIAIRLEASAQRQPDPRIESEHLVGRFDCERPVAQVGRRNVDRRIQKLKPTPRHRVLALIKRFLRAEYDRRCVSPIGFG